MSVARLTAMYLQAWKNRSGKKTRGFVSLLFHGRELVDEKPLSYYRIADGDVLVHVYYANTGRSNMEIDYSAMANEYDQMALMDELNEDDEGYDTRWNGGDTWRNFPPVSFNNIWESTEPSIPHNSLTLSPKGGPKNASQAQFRDQNQTSDVPDGRRFKACYKCPC